MSKQKEWRVDASFELRPDSMAEDTTKAEKVVGKPVSDAGTLIGSSARDVGWHFSTEQEALEAATKLKAAGYDGVEVTPPAEDEPAAAG